MKSNEKKKQEIFNERSEFTKYCDLFKMSGNSFHRFIQEREQ